MYNFFFLFPVLVEYIHLILCKVYKYFIDKNNKYNNNNNAMAPDVTITKFESDESLEESMRK